MSVRVELFTASWCPRCASAGRKLGKIMSELGDDTMTLRFVDVLQELDYAVALGVISTPAVAIDGELVFSTLPSDSQLRGKLLKLLTVRRQTA